jgi:hypothetical protein
MNRINAFRNIAKTGDSVAWGNRTLGNETKNIATNIWGNASALFFAAVLIACSVTVGCSSDNPKTVSSNNQIPVNPAPVAQAPGAIAQPAAMQAEKKPAKKVVHKKPATVNYADKTYGVTFEYPRRYAIETGNAAQELLASNPLPMNFVQPGGVALAAVELPETGYANTDFSSAFFNVSVNKSLTGDQCGEFSVPQPKSMPLADAQPAAETTTANTASDAVSSNASTGTATPIAAEVPATAAKSEAEQQGSKLMLGDLELRATEAVSGEGTRQSDSKYFHVFQNGACYEFALNVTTVASQDGLMKHVDRDKVFTRLGAILSTVKINPVVAPEVTAETPVAPAAPETPAQ